jgi:hypothetical protein
MIDSVPQVSAPEPASTLKPDTDPSRTALADPATSQPAARLYVEQDGTGVYVYRLVDTATGRVLAEVPRDRLHDLKGSPDYEAGALVSTSA